ncbi:polyprenol phosphomannose-dependent alpha 1,6 mannosyltransferase MptB [Tsukamurella sp. 8F]|uniref:polyprenol phosphomannose-dependent alpha 1,6 mannosyltransferase MptB n=1 Tax=unclassified Tsukamurella TaxID=2633480 RepID=UPI0023BA34A4|nr:MULTISPECIES: polyprenol phosphomannose-dependent alpha 1,6 mannosyltransferase MptB [unclassified Tsukamurella]MDF0528571.1 polyprenol phosphomannose-dependent alpha 1,6 mannosyltransferase MptB [Tsukamurella sp. 8J]MDF0585533.1 polyprenol phosphomannose-dependent alpha 1,6 mannosyltransferase MptB [Tsukamurella sp. 8F]
MHGDEGEYPDLLPAEKRQARRIAMFGGVGAVLIAFGALGVGSFPVVQNPIAGVRLFGLMFRMPSTALTVAMTGTAMLMLAWVLLRRYTVGYLAPNAHRPPAPPRRLQRRAFDRILALWCLPFVFAPPMFSKDVYSYLAQSEITARGMDPYRIGPAAALGIDHVFTRSVPNIWRDTPAPYGPLFLYLGRGITALTGENIVEAVVLHRLLALAGVAFIVWALPRLARRCGVNEVAALWLGAANPLLIFHLIAGIHNEALMLGLMLVGIEWALRAIDSGRSFLGGTARLERPWLPSRTGWLLVAGAATIAASSLIKITSVLAMGFVGMALARRLGAVFPNIGGRAGNWRLALTGMRPTWRRTTLALATSACLLAVVLVAVVVLVCQVTGLGYGWLDASTLGTANKVRSWMSIPTILGLGTGQIGVLLGLGDHTTAILALTRPLAAAIAAVIVCRMLLGTLSGRIHPVGAIGVSMAAIVLLFPVVQPWYLLWAIIPLAAWATAPAFRLSAVIASCVVSLMLMPNGGEIEPYVIARSAITTAIVVALYLYLTFGGGRALTSAVVARVRRRGPSDRAVR